MEHASLQKMHIVNPQIANACNLHAIIRVFQRKMQNFFSQKNMYSLSQTRSYAVKKNSNVTLGFFSYFFCVPLYG